MAQVNVQAPSLPQAPAQYSQSFMDRFTNVLRLYFNRLDNAGPIAAATQRNGGVVFSALSFSQPDPSIPGQFVVSLPTEAEYANLRAGDVYYDTTANNVLKVKV